MGKCLVSVIVAILAAISIPTLVGYIGRAKAQQTLTEARAVTVASQTLGIENFAADGDASDLAPTKAQINAVTGSCTVTLNTNGQVTAMTYTAGGYTATLASGAWTVA